MAQNIGIRRGKSPTRVTLEQRLKAKRRDPEGYKNFYKDMLGGVKFAAESAAEYALFGPTVKLFKLGKNLYKAKKRTTVPLLKEPLPQGLKKGGTARGKGAAISGTKFSGIY